MIKKLKKKLQKTEVAGSKEEACSCGCGCCCGKKKAGVLVAALVVAGLVWEAIGMLIIKKIVDFEV